VEAIAPCADDRFLEIGPGPGALTLRLAPRVARLTAIEVDRDLAAALAPRLPAHVTLVTGDVLDLDLTPFLAGGPVRVAGNLPYNISSPILFKLFAAADKKGLSPFRDATLMLQREVADRLVAAPGTRDYGVLTIFTAVQADVERLLILPPGAFRPAPKVHSAVVRLSFRSPAVRPELFPVFEPMVRTMFMQRRKVLLNALRRYAEEIGADASRALAAARIDPTRRPETLQVSELSKLAEVFASR